MSSIVHYTPVYYDALLAYSRKQWPHKTDSYMHYRLLEFPESPEDASMNLLALGDSGEIVGCNLYFPTKALIHGKEEKVYWSHDTIIDKEFRGDLGMMLMLEKQKNERSFGAGLTEINYKIQKVLKTKFLGQIYCYVILNGWAPFKLLRSFFCEEAKKEKLDVPRTIKSGKYRFERVDCAEQMNIPNKGYWFGANTEIEFVRDKHFLEKRFFKNFNTYYLYVHRSDTGKDDMYFVVRSILLRKMNVLSIVDFRCDLLDMSRLKAIIRAASKMAGRNRLPFCVFRSTLRLKRSFYSLEIAQKKTSVVMAPKNLSLEFPEAVIYTIADSDSDFLSK